MKGVILAGGTGSRLFPLTKITNKHLLPVGRYPMIYHSIYKLSRAEIRDIMIITGREHMGDIVNLLGSGSDFGVRFTYRVQDEAGGIAQALFLAKDFVGEDFVTVILGDNVFEDEIVSFVEEFKSQRMGAHLLIKEVHDPQRYGVPQLEDGKIISIVEKPKYPASSYAITGIYMYDSRVFEVIPKLEPSTRGELEITDVNNWYVEQGQARYSVLRGWWTDAGTHESYARANDIARDIIFSNC